MGDQREHPWFDQNNTSNTRFWHARKFRDSTSVLRGGMCEDTRSGYFAGAFMGRKFKNPANREFERSLEYLLDDLSATSGESSMNVTPRLDSVTPSMGSSCTSLDTIVGRESMDSEGNIKDGFMIDVTISDRHMYNNNKKSRPRSDIFDFLQGTMPASNKSGLPMSKTQSLCDVSLNPTKPKRITSAKEAKMYEKEFENVLDDLHSTIKDLDSFSRETLGESLESLTSSVESVNSLTTSEQVSSMSAMSEDVSTSQSQEEDDISDRCVNHNNDIMDISKYTITGKSKQQPNQIPHENAAVLSNNYKTNDNSNKKGKYDYQLESLNKLKLENMKKQQLVGIHQKKDLKLNPHDIMNGHKENKGTNSGQHGDSAPDHKRKLAYHKPVDPTTISQDSSSQGTMSTAMTQSVDSVMSSITDLSVVGSEIGYIADMDEATINTPTITMPWLDMNVINSDPDTGLGDCFAPVGFRPLNFVGVESKYMIAPYKNSDLRIPTPVKLRKSISTQTSGKETEKDKFDNNKPENNSNVKQTVSISTQTDRHESSPCDCNSNNITSAVASTKQAQQQQQPQQHLLLRVSDNKNISSRKRRISYCSSVDISPLLNGSLLYDQTPIRAKSVDSLLLFHHNRNQQKLYNPVRRNDMICNNSVQQKCRIVEKTLVKRPDIVVTVHSLQNSISNATQNFRYSEKTDGLLLKYKDYKGNFIATPLHNSVSKKRTRSLPNIHYTNDLEELDVKQDRRLRKYASTLIISNVNRYLLTNSKQQQQHCIKRTSYTQDINVNSCQQSRSLPRHRGKEKSAAKLRYSSPTSKRLSGAICDKHKLKPLTTTGNIMTYTF